MYPKQNIQRLAGTDIYIQSKFGSDSQPDIKYFRLFIWVAESRHFPGYSIRPHAHPQKSRRESGAYPDFEVGGLYKAVAVVFSDDGDTLYVATSTTVFSIAEDGDKSTENWSKEVDDGDLCDIAVNGMSVRLTCA